MSTLILAVPSPCPRSAQSRARTWQSSDSADLTSFGEPDHGLLVYLGRCRACTVIPLAVVPVSESFGGTRAVVEVHGTPR